jgi:hypothetical protein
MEELFTPSKIKIDRAKNVSEEIFDHCLSYLSNYDNKQLLQMGALLGEFVNCLRSPLNYYTNFILSTIIQSIDENEKKKLGKKPKLDYPWMERKENFENNKVMEVMRKYALSFYTIYESLQPYHANYGWVGDFMKLSNHDKHKITNNVISPIASHFVAIKKNGTTLKPPMFVGENLVYFSKGEVLSSQLPCYFSPIKAFASPRHEWSLFLIPMTPTFNVDLINFTRTVPDKVLSIITILNSEIDKKPKIIV